MKTNNIEPTGFARAELRNVTAPDYSDCRTAYSHYDDKYKDPAFWRRRMLGIHGTGRLIAVGAYVGEKWAGGFVTYPLPMRGPHGEKLRGGKMESCIVAQFARGKKYLFNNGREEKISVAVSRGLIGASLEEGLQIVYGCPNVPAYKAHREAGHGLIDLRMFYLGLCLRVTAWRRAQGLMKYARLITYAGNSLFRLFGARSSGALQVAEVSRFSEEFNELDEEVAVALPGIGIVRSDTFLNWRFASDEYVRLECRDESGALKGYLVGERGGVADTVQIIDFIAKPNCPEAAYSLLARYLQHAKDKRASEIRFKSAGDGPLAKFQRRMLMKMRFFPFYICTARWIVDGGNGCTTDDLLRPAMWNAGGICFDSP